MALIRVHVHLLLPQTRFQTNHRSLTNLRVSCSNSKSKRSDVDLAMELGTEMEKMKRQTVQTQEAMKSSRKLLYAELCLYLGLGKEELRRKWERMDEDDKWILAQEFVSDWGSNFHPLSARSVKELVDQHLFHDAQHHISSSSSSSSSSSFYLFSGFKKLIGFPDENNNK